MKKWLIGVVLLWLVVVLSFPISNLVVKPTVPTTLSSAKPDDSLFTSSARALEKKCSYCHSPGAPLPFYADFPIAESMIEEDVNGGLAYFEFVTMLLPADRGPTPEVSLAKLEHTIVYDTMPPKRFRALHWDGALNETEKNAVLSWVTNVRRTNYAPAGYPEEVQNRPIQPLPQSVDLNEAKVALGDKLFHDTRFSTDSTLSCASCHGLDKGGTDQQQFSKGVGGMMGGINSPTVFNSSYQFLQFWDGRAADLFEQADGPVNNPIEMASNWTEVIGKIQQDEALTAEVKKVYPDGLAGKNFRDAIAEFERSLITPNSRFDKFLTGDADALTADEKKGYELFQFHACHTCHVGKILGGQSFEKMGLKADYFTARGKLTEADNGRFSVTQDEADRYKFKVPTLRNIVLTYPYFHDGSTSDLKEAAKTMAKYQRGVELTDADADFMVQFMKSLTGEYKGKVLE
jgi:cytochrome c peroxidase